MWKKHKAFNETSENNEEQSQTTHSITKQSDYKQCNDKMK